MEDFSIPNRRLYSYYFNPNQLSRNKGDNESFLLREQFKEGKYNYFPFNFTPVNFSKLTPKQKGLAKIAKPFLYKVELRGIEPLTS